MLQDYQLQIPPAYLEIAPPLVPAEGRKNLRLQDPGSKVPVTET